MLGRASRTWCRTVAGLASRWSASSRLVRGSSRQSRRIRIRNGCASALYSATVAGRNSRFGPGTSGSVAASVTVIDFSQSLWPSWPGARSAPRPDLPEAVHRVRALEPGRRHLPGRAPPARPAHHPLAGRGRRRRPGRPPPLAALRAAGRRAGRPARPAPHDGPGRPRPGRAHRRAGASWWPSSTRACLLLYVVAFALGIGETLFDTAAQSIIPMVVDRRRARPGQRPALRHGDGDEPVRGPAARRRARGRGHRPRVHRQRARLRSSPSSRSSLIKGSFRPSREGEVPARLRTDIAEGVRYLLGHRLLRTMAFMVGVMNLCTSAVFGLLPLYAVDPGPMGLSESGLRHLPHLLGARLGGRAAGRRGGWCGCSDAPGCCSSRC